MKLSTSGLGGQQAGQEGEKKCLNSELWHACAGPLVSLPTAGSRVVYFPQGHSEQVAATTNKEVDAHIPNYPSLPPQLICQLHNVTMHADVETDEVYAQMTLQPLTPQEQKETFLPMDLGMPSKQPTNYFCKTLTASDTSTHGGFSVPRRAAEKVFPPLDFTQQPPAQELIARDLHDVEWKFRHIFRGQPKRHLLTTGWSVFVSAKRLVAGDSVLFIWNEKNQLLLGIRRATRPQTVMPSSVLSSDSMHIGLLAAAAHAAATNSCFTVFYNPRASPSEFVIPLSKYVKAVFHTRISVGMRFRMLFETEESSVRRYMGTITGISDLDPVRWPNSHWRSVKVGWDESTAGERQPRVSLWEIEPLTTFPMYPSLFPLRLKRPWHPGSPSFLDSRDEASNGLMWLRGASGEPGLPSLNFQANMLPWMQQRLDPTMLGNDHNQRYQAMLAAGMQNLGSGDPLRQQFMQLQQPFQYLQQSSSHNPLLQLQQQQQAIQQSIPHNILQAQNQISTESLPRHLLQQQLNNQPDDQAQQHQHIYHDGLQIQTDQLQRQQSNLPSPSFSKTEYMDSSSKFSATNTPMQNMLGSLCSEGSVNLLDFSRAGQSTLTEQLPQQSWVPKYAHQQVNAFANSISLPRTYPEKDPSMEAENCSSDAQNPTLFGANIDSSGLLLPTTVPRYSTSSIDADVSSMPLGDSGFQNSLYGCVQDSSDLLSNAGQMDPPTPRGELMKEEQRSKNNRFILSFLHQFTGDSMANLTPTMARSFLQVAATEEVAPPLRVVQIEGLVVLKIIKHCKEFSPSLVTGQLLGLDVGSVLEITNCFPFPIREEDEEIEADGANYQLEMMRCLREVNVDNNTVGWYQSMLFGCFQTVELIETFMNYQENIKRCVCIIYDPSRANQGALALKALKLSDSFMDLYRNNNFTGEKLREKNLSWVDIFEEIPIKVSNSALISAFMTELEADTPVTQCDYDRLQLSTSPYLERNVEFLIECMDDLSGEQQKFQYHYRNLSRQQAQQQAWLQKRRSENMTRKAAGEEPLPEEDPSNAIFKPIPEPSRLGSFLITNQMANYCNQINGVSGQSFSRLYLMKALHKD